MRPLSLGLSVLLHLALLAGTWWYLSTTPPTIRLDVPVYQVDIVTLKPKPAPTKPKVTKPKPVAKPKPQPKKTAKPEPKPVKKVEAAKPKPKPKKVAAKTTKRKPKPKPKPPTADQLIAEALAKAKNEAKDVPPPKPQPTELEKALADLSPQDVAPADQSAANVSEALYAQDVIARVRPNWRYPAAASGLGLMAQVRITLDKNGVIRDTELVASSGRHDYDASVLRAIQKTEALSPPPASIGQTVTINFNLQDLTG